MTKDEYEALPDATLLKGQTGVTWYGYFNKKRSDRINAVGDAYATALWERSVEKAQAAKVKVDNCPDCTWEQNEACRHVFSAIPYKDVEILGLATGGRIGPDGKEMYRSPFSDRWV
jgi:hypothetical protein